MTKKKIKESNDNDLVGLTLDEAKKKTEATIRVVKRNGILTVVTRDFKIFRINVEVEDEKIVAVKGRG